MAKQQITLKEVALEAGVSLITASNIISGKRLNHASPATRDKVQEAARKLGYRPNLAARQLASRGNNIIGLLIDSMSPMFYRDVMMYIEQMVTKNGYRLQIGMLHDNIESISRYVEDFACTGIENIICAAHNYPAFSEKIPPMMEQFKHVVFLEEPSISTSFPFVAADHYQNYYSIIKGLAERGRRRIVCCARRSVYRDASFYAARKGVMDGYAAAGIPWEECFWNTERGIDGLPEILKCAPDALIVPNEYTMFMALRYCHEHKISVPGNLALFGAELSKYGKVATPTFSGLDYQPKVLAESIISSLLAQINPDKESPLEMAKYIPATLFWGESTGNPNNMKHQQNI